MTRSYFLLIAGGLTLACFLGTLSLMSLYRLIKANDIKDLTLIYEKNLVDALSRLKDIETGQRGYIITGKESFLEPYQIALDKIDDHLQLIRKNIEDLGQAEPLFKELNSLIEIKLQQSYFLINMRREKGFNLADQLLKQEESKRQMDNIRLVIAQMLDNAFLLIEKKKEQANHLKNYTFFINSLSVFTSFILVGLYSYLFYRNSNELKKIKFKFNQIVELYQAILENFMQVLITTDKEGKITSFSKGAEKSLGYKMDEVINSKSILEFYDLQIKSPTSKEAIKENHTFISDDFKTIIASIDYLVWTGSDWTIKRKNGSLFTCKQFVSPLRNEKNEIQGYLFNWQDLSEQKLKNQELKNAKSLIETLSLEKEQVIAALTYELQVPLHTIANLSQLMAKNKRGNLKKQELFYIYYIKEACELIDHVLLKVTESLKEVASVKALTPSVKTSVPLFDLLTVLIVDQDPKFCQKLKSYCEQLGCQALIAEIKEKRLEVAQEKIIDLIIVEFDFSSDENTSVFHQLKREEKLSLVPLAVMYAKDREIPKNISNVISFLVKPIHLLDIENLLQLLCAKRKEAAKNREFFNN